MYGRVIDEQVLTLAASGWTYKNTFVLYDKQTESLWYHKKNSSGLTGITGEYADRFLPELPSVKMRWNQWFNKNPDTKILKCRLEPTAGVCANYIPR